jgi:hypothetical protein
LSLTLFELVDCTKQETLGYSNMDVNQSIQCGTKEHAPFKLLFLFLFPVYVTGIPLFIFTWIYTYVIRQNHQYHRRSKTRFGFYFMKYKGRAWWWELVFMARKLSVPVIKMFTDSVAVLFQIAGSFIIFLAFAVLHNVVDPFIEKVRATKHSFTLQVHDSSICFAS